MSTTLLHKTGELDPSFGERGVLPLNIEDGAIFRAYGLNSIDDKLLVSASVLKDMNTYTQGHFVYFNLQADGQPNQGFGKNGIVTGLFEPSDQQWPSNGLKVLTADHQSYLLCGALTHNSSTPVPAVAKSQLTGAPVPQFGKNGLSVLNLPITYEQGPNQAPGVDAALQSTGKIITLHLYTGEPGHWEALIARINADGQTDLAFNSGRGYIDTLKAGENTALAGLAIQADDKILAYGHSVHVRGIKTGILQRYTSEGAVDTTFAISGEYRTQDHQYLDLVATHEKILACGSAAQGALLISLDPDGVPDPGFNNGLPVITANVTRWHKLLVDAGKIVAVGTLEEVLNKTAVMARFNSNGEIDTSFGPNGTGIVELDFNQQFSEPIGLVMDQQKRLLVLMSLSGLTLEPTFLLACYFSESQA